MQIFVDLFIAAQKYEMKQIFRKKNSLPFQQE